MADEPEHPAWLPESLAKQARWLPADGARPEGMYVRVGGRIGRLTATLRLHGEDLDPEEVTRLLGCEPTRIDRKGDPYSRPSRSLRRVNGWSLESRQPESATIDEHIADLLGRVSNDIAIWRMLERFKPDIFVGVFLTGFNQGGSLSPALAAKLGERGIRLDFDIYSAANDML